MAVKLYVGNLPFSITDEDLRQLFDAYTVVSASVVTDRDTGRSRGFAFVEVEQGESAISEMNGKEIDGRQLTVNEARPKEAGGGGRGGFRGGGRGGGYDRNNRGGGRGGYGGGRNDDNSGGNSW